MTEGVVTAGPDASIAELAGLLTRERISAVPVVAEDGRLLGVVSEADLSVPPLHSGLAPRRPAGAGVARASDVMSRPVHTAAADELLSTAARRMHQRKVRRLFVTDDAGRVRAVLSRADLLRLHTRGDDALRRDVTEQVLRDTLWIGPRQVRAQSPGRRGDLDRRGRPAQYRRDRGPPHCRGTGVADVVDDIAFGFDDAALLRSRAGRTHPFSAEPFAS